LVLEDGTAFRGSGFGAERASYGEVVFCTGMTGYEEALSDPSYNGQILVMTYPLIGNYGVDASHLESDRLHVEGFVVREACAIPAQHAGAHALDDFLANAGIPGLAGIDTRALTSQIRSRGVMNGAVVVYSQGEPDLQELLQQIRAQPSTSEIDLVAQVTCREPTRYDVRGRHEVVLIDCGVKRSILRELLRRRVNVTVVPANTPSQAILDHEPAGVVISNGPGDPARLTDTIDTLQRLQDRLPLLGICLGHQLLALAGSAQTYKMKFGHRGINQPVKELASGRIHITTQNHGFAVEPATVADSGFLVSSINANDGTIEGLVHRDLPILTAQYHPEGHPGPSDAAHIFDHFLEWLAEA
jgi:carbamoyl-phosphate synthase small subunit